MPEVRAPGLGFMDPWSRVEGTHLRGQMHEQHSSHRALGLAVALFRPIQSVGLEYLQEPLLPVPEDPIRSPSSRYPHPPSSSFFPGLSPPGLAESSEVQEYRARSGPKPLGVWDWGSLGITKLIPVTLG